MRRVRRLGKLAVRFVLWDHVGLTAVIALALGVRIALLRWWSAWPFGDVFNFISIARQLAHGAYPVDEKRLPFYPFLILLGHGVLPQARWESIAIGIAITMSLVSLVLLYAIGRTLKIGKVPLLIALLLVSSYEPFLAYSIRGYADTTFITLLLASILAVFRARTWRGALIVGGLCGLLALTRYEGLVVLPLLGVAHVLRHPRSLSRLLLPIVAAGIMILPYVIVAHSSGRSLLPATYLAQAGRQQEGYGADSWHDFRDRYTHILGRIGLFAAWRTLPYIVNEMRDNLLTSHHSITRLFTDPRSITSLLAVPGFLWLLFRQPRHGILLLGVLLAVAVPIAWWAPLIRYDTFLFPFVALAAGAGIHACLRLVARASRPGVSGMTLQRSAATFLIIAGMVWFMAFTEEARNSLRKTQFRGYAWYQAIHAARALPGPVAFDEWSELAGTYFGERLVPVSDIVEENERRADQWRILRARGVSGGVVRLGVGERPFFHLLEHVPPDVRIEEVAHFQVTQGNHDNDEAAVIRIHFPS